jgi:hypothetical protein
VFLARDKEILGSSAVIEISHASFLIASSFHIGTIMSL